MQINFKDIKAFSLTSECISKRHLNKHLIFISFYYYLNINISFKYTK